VPEGARRRSTSVKVVITGPYGAGKTTLVRTLSEIDVLTTERRVSLPDEADPAKATTTVAMDFGRLTIDEGLQLYLFGTPGQKRFDFMWEILAEGMLGFVVMLDDSRPDSHEEAHELLQHFAQRSARTPYVVAVNKVGPGLADQAARRARHMLRLEDHVRVVAGDARDRDWAKETLLELFQAARETAARTAPARSGA
jgi:signal recognition particle receptor subunit beta